MTRPDSRPTLRDLHYWSGIDAFADEVIFIHQQSYYTRKLSKKEDLSRFAPGMPPEIDPDEGIADIIVVKQRNGPVGTI